MLSGQNFTISYAGGRAYDVVLTRTTTPPMFSGLARYSRQGFSFQGVGDPGARYVIQSSPTLLPGSWINLGTLTADALGAFRFEDTNITFYPRRFYRAQSP